MSSLLIFMLKKSNRLLLISAKVSINLFCHGQGLHKFPYELK